MPYKLQSLKKKIKIGIIQKMCENRLKEEDDDDDDDYPCL